MRVKQPGDGRNNFVLSNFDETTTTLQNKQDSADDEITAAPHLLRAPKDVLIKE